MCGRGVVENLAASIGTCFRGIDEPAGDAVIDLRDDPADAAGDHRPRLPERLRNRQPESLFDRLLNRHRRVHLECVHLDRTNVVQVREDEDVRVVGRILDRAVVVLPPLRVVMRHRPDERELDVRVSLLHGPIGVDHAERVLPRIEPRDLRQQRAAGVHAELVDDVLRVLARERHVLRRERIDRGRPDERLGKAVNLRHVLAKVEDRGVVAADRRKQNIEDVRVGRREIDVPSPDPLRTAFGKVIDHCHRLRVVNDHEVVVVRRKETGVLLVVAVEDLDLSRRERTRIALKPVVDRLRDIEELFGTPDHPPFDLEPDVRHQRHKRVIDLGDTAAECRGREMHDAFSTQRLSQPVDVVDEAARHNRSVIGEALVSGVDELKQDAQT